MDKTFRKAADIICEYINERSEDIEDPLRFANDVLSYYIINAENESIVGFSESIFRETIVDLLSTDAAEESDIEVMAQIPVSCIDYDSPFQRKRRGSVSASGNPFAQVEEHPKDKSVSEMLLNILKNTRVIAQTMDTEQMEKLVATMYVQPVKSGEELIKQDEYGKTMYLIESGEFQIWKNGKLRATLRENSLFGEISLLYSCPRTASVLCTIDAQVWVVTSDAYTSILMVQQRKNRELICAFLEKNKKYVNLSAKEKERVLQSVHILHFSKDDAVTVSDPGIFLVLEVSASEKEANKGGNAVYSERIVPGKTIPSGTVCRSDTTVLFIPDFINAIIDGKDKKVQFNSIK
ncbi:cAMP-dependent protein kinase regulator [Nematocida minor]|uniref:cAMP-dependent protein kinase regulator n=1 Tax=Nematocida minor TaxID=1912983 RepID=UPI00221EC71A|nr:cAMP-dependent protein kinase regulator [Nematocida minor]XP_051332069.1 cAMP-dependent protein kinase regulator [Nematocida minor]KAI5188799.1 cAMP-dependent protein kinase regulator [Nematocida minor]KAI5188903.1 cAMP-dependent protein kinase regulator [Nematocida minor]